jgi:hypothetical protein
MNKAVELAKKNHLTFAGLKQGSERGFNTAVEMFYQAVCAEQREADAALCNRFAEREMHPAECAAAIRSQWK